MSQSTLTLPTTPLPADPVEIRRALSLLIEPGAVTELRVVNTHRGTVSGYYDDPDPLVRDAELWNGKGPAVYVLPQPILPDLLARACNRYVEYARTTTSDTDVVRRRWLLIDCDAVRPAGISSSDAESQAARERAREIAAWLRECGWGGIGIADSGNGGHLLARIDLPNDPEAEALVKDCLAALAARFDDARVKVDPTTFNAARVWKLYGTLSAKGDAIPSRPHRRAQLIEPPDPVTPISRELLITLAREAPATLAPTPRPLSPATNGHAPRGDYATLDVVRWFAAHGCYGRAMSRGQHAVLCPWEYEHTTVRRPEDSDTVVWEAENGGWPQFHCLHAHCAGRTITDVIAYWGDADRYCAAERPGIVWPVLRAVNPGEVREPTCEPPTRVPSDPGDVIESIDPLTRIDSDPPRYEATVRGHLIELSFLELTDFTQFKAACIRRLNFVPFLPYKTGHDGKHLRPQYVWERFILTPALQQMQEAGRIEAAPADAGDFGAAWEAIRMFFRRMRPTHEREDLLTDKLVIEEKTYLFRGPTLRSWLSKNRLDTLRASDLWAVIRAHGGQPRRVRVGKATMAVWAVPMEADEEGDEESDGDE